VWFLPAEKNKYGRVYFGLSDKWPQGGMNDQGLFFDGAACSLLEVIKSTDKPTYYGNLSERVLEQCATVHDALELLAMYNLGYFRNGQMMIADRHGNSVIVEGDTIIHRTGHSQVVTNFYKSMPDLGGYPCPRYDIAEVMLNETDILSIDYFRNVLDAVHTKGYTQYSNVYDLTNGLIYLFRDSEFEECVKLNLQEELNKGKKTYSIASLFLQRDTDCKTIDGRGHYTGSYQTLHDNGNVKVALSLKDGKLNGLSYGYYPDGQMSWIRDYENNKLCRFWKQWDENGQQTLEIEVDNEYIHKAVEYYSGGARLFELTFDKTDPEEIVVWNENGAESYSGSYEDGLLYLDGEAEAFTGDLVTYFASGLIHMKRTFKDGEKHGVFVEWDQDGSKIEERVFEDNVLIEVHRFR
jgi:antitoxin component YwqK of YwqJK toxin-antitoxin module